MMSDLSLIVMAAGLGSRYGGLKQLDKFGPQGQTMVDYAVQNAIALGFNQVVFIIRKSFYEDFKDTVGSYYVDKIKVDYAFQELENIPSGFEFNKEREKPWGTGHAVLSAKPYIKGNFAVVNADDYYGKQAFNLLVEHFHNYPNNYCNIVYPIQNTLSAFGGVSRGVCENEKGVLKKIREVHNIKKSDDVYTSDDSIMKIDNQTLVSMNFWGFNRDLFKYLEIDFMKFCKEGNLDKLKSEFLLPEVVDRLILENHKIVNVAVCNELWYGVTYQKDCQYVREQLAKLEQ